MLVKKIFNATGTLLETRDYIGNFEFVNGVIESVNHSEGRYKSTAANVYRHEYNFKDHLGNTRLVYTDVNNNGYIEVNSTEILQEAHYYAFGLQMSNISSFQSSGTDYRYKYNGIERLKDLNINYDMAFYRGLDPLTGRWLQIDPKAEKNANISPYCSMKKTDWCKAKE